MTNISIKILGCSGSMGVPMLGCSCKVCLSDNPKNKRTRCSAILNINGYKLLIDTSPDMRAQFIREGLTDIDGIFLTHYHADHLLGIEDLRALFFSHKKRFPVYANQQTIDELLLRFNYLMKFKIEDQPFLDLKVIDPYQELIINNKKIQTFDIKHGKLTCSGLRINDLVYAVDVEYIPEESFKVINDAKILIMDVTAPHKVGIHQGFEEAFEISKKARIKETWFTHITHYVDYGIQLPPGFYLCHDGLELAGN